MCDTSKTHSLEHLHTRSKLSVFDVSHMGNLRVEGGQADAFLQRICTRGLDGTEVGQSKYSHICRHDGGIARLAKAGGADDR